MLVDFLIVSIIVGVLRKGSLKGLANIPFKGIEGIFISFFIRYLSLPLKGKALEIAVRYNIAIVAVSYLILLYVLIINHKIKPLRLVALGVLLNAAVIAANAGKMPVSVPLAKAVGLDDLIPLLTDPEYLYHTAVTGATKLSYLGDVFPLPPPYPKPRVFSIGDLLMGTGMFLTVQNAMLPKKQ